MQLEISGMNVRKADKKDIINIQIIAEAAWRPTYLHIIGEQQCAYMLEWMYNTAKLEEQMDAGIHFFMLENNQSKAIGFAAFEKTAEKKGKLHKLYTNPFLKEKGAGTLLLEGVKDLANKLGVEIIELNVNRHNSAFEFYLKKGFKVAYEMDLDIGNGYFMNDYVMELALSN